MTPQNEKWIALTLLWITGCGIVWAIVKYAKPGTAIGLLAILFSATYFGLLSLLIFGRKVL